MVQTPDWHSLALESDGTLWGWGANDHGQLGNGTTNDAFSPTPVLWPVPAQPPVAAINLINSRILADGSYQFGFTNNPGAQFTVLSAANPTLPSANWTALGGTSEILPGLFQFTDSEASNSPQRFYRVSSP
jgi:alpha-tubulin suppressor-like RCC1 family protein